MKLKSYPTFVAFGYAICVPGAKEIEIEHGWPHKDRGTKWIYVQTKPGSWIYKKDRKVSA